MTKTESKYFIVTRKVLSTGKEYKVEYSADSFEEIKVVEADHIDELNKFGKDYETIKIDGPFTESTNNYLVIFKNKEIKAFLDTSKRNLDLILENRAGGVKEIRAAKSPKETADKVLRIAKEIAQSSKVAAGKLKEIAEKAIANIHSKIQVLIDSQLKKSLNKKLLKNNQLKSVSTI